MFFLPTDLPMVFLGKPFFFHFFNNCCKSIGRVFGNYLQWKSVSLLSSLVKFTIVLNDGNNFFHFSRCPMNTSVGTLSKSSLIDRNVVENLVIDEN